MNAAQDPCWKTRILVVSRRFLQYHFFQLCGMVNGVEWHPAEYVRLGKARREFLFCPFRAIFVWGDSVPRALPWATLVGPFRALGWSIDVCIADVQGARAIAQRWPGNKGTGPPLRYGPGTLRSLAMQESVNWCVVLGVIA
jgi:hypothetical protein